MLFVICFHPENGNVLFLLRGYFDIYQYEIGSRKCEKVFEFSIPGNKSPDIRYMKKSLISWLNILSLNKTLCFSNFW